jgi:IstB-like ATP binding protein
MIYVGIDLHRKRSQISALDERSTRASLGGGSRSGSRSGRSSPERSTRASSSVGTSAPSPATARSPPRARTGAARAARRPGRAGGRPAAARSLRPADPGVSATTSELAFLFRTLKAPAAGQGAADAGRARPPRGVELRALRPGPARNRGRLPRRARRRGTDQAGALPARKTLEEFDFSFQRSVQKTLVLHLGQLDFLTAKDNVVLVGPPGTGKTHCETPAGPSWAAVRVGTGSGGDDSKDSLIPSFDKGVLALDLSLCCCRCRPGPAKLA